MYRIHFKELLLLAVVGIVTLVAGDATAQSAVADELEYAEKLLQDGMYDLAKNELKRLTGREISPPVRQRALILLGDAAVASSELAEANRSYLLAYEASPTGGEACLALKKAGEASFLREDFRGAVEVLQRLPVRFPDCPHACAAMSILGRAYAALGDYEQAVREFERLLAACEGERDNPETAYWLAKAEVGIDPEKGRTRLENLVQSFPGTLPAFAAGLDLAAELEREGNTLAALSAVDHVLKQKLEKDLRASGLAMRGRLLGLLGRFGTSGESFTECFSLCADSALCEDCNLSAQAAFLKARDYRRADQAAEKLLSRACGEAARETSLLTRAEAATSREDFRGALGFLEEIRRAIGVDSLYCVARLREGQARERVSDFTLAESLYVGILGLSCPHSVRAEALVALADLYSSKMSSPEKAALYYGLLVESNPASESVARAIFEMARIAEVRGDYAEAARHLKRIASEFPLNDRADAARERAEALEALFPRRPGEAELRKLGEMIGSAASGSVQSEMLLLRASELLMSEFRAFDEAVALLRQALQSVPADRKYAVLLYLGKAHVLLAKKAEALGNESEAAKHMKSALRYYGTLDQEYSNSQYGDDARLELVKAELEKMPVPARYRAGVSLYSDFLKTYPQTDRFDEALLLRGKALEGLSEKANDQFAVEAIATYDKLLTEFPRSSFVPEARARRIVILRRAGNSRAAESEFEAVRELLQTAASGAEAAYEIGEAKLAERDTEKAVSLYSLAAGTARSRTLRERAIARRGDCYLVSGQYDRAVTEYEYVLDRDPGGPFADDLLAKISRAYLGAGKLDEASEAVQRLTQEFPKSSLIPGLLMQKAETEEARGELHSARSTYEELARRFPESRSDSTFVRQLGRVSFNSGDFETSAEAYELLLSMDVSDRLRQEAGRSVVLSLARLADESKLKKRLAWYLAAFPSDSTLTDEVTLERGMSLYASGNYEDAYVELARVEGRLRPRPRATALLTMGLAKLRLGDPEGASGMFRRVLAGRPDVRPDTAASFTAGFKLGTSLYAMSRYEEASQAYLDASRFCRELSDCCEAWYNGALCLEKVEQWATAAAAYLKVGKACEGKLGKDGTFKAAYCELNARDYRRAIELFQGVLDDSGDEEKPEVQFWIGEAYAGAGEFERAASEFLKVPYLYGDGSLWAVTARYKAGLAFERAGQKEAALKQYRAIIQREGEDSEWGSMAKERVGELSR